MAVAPPGREDPLTTALRRVGALGRPVPVRQVPAAIVRVPRRKPAAVPGRWPLPPAAVRAWAVSQTGWRLTEADEIVPVEPPPSLHRHDRLIVMVLAGGERTWTALHNGLVGAGLSSPTAAAAILYSPVLRRTPTGYTLLGPTGRRRPARAACAATPA